MPRWNRQSTSRFLDALRRGCTVTQAAAASGISRVSAYRRRARDARFAHKWDTSLAYARDIRITNILQTPARSLALDGRITEHASTGHCYDRIDRKSNTALLALLRRLDRMCADPAPTCAAPANPQISVAPMHQSRHSL